MKFHKMSETHDPTSLCWYYDDEALYKTPSIQDGISFKTECRYRKEGARLIIDIGGKMELGYNTLATGVVFFHRFYMFHSFKTFPRYVTACSCLFLAGKVEETPKKCKDIVKAAQELISEKKFECFGDDPKEEVMTLEKIILQTIKFDLKVKHPYSYLTRYAKSLKGNSNKLQRMVQMAWIFINDSLCTTLPIQWEPEIIAIAVMYLAGKLCKFTVQTWHSRKPEHKYWWDLFVEDLKVEVLEDICHQVLDLYSPFQNNKSPRKNPVPATYTPPLKKKKQLALQTTLQPESQTSSQSTSLTPPLSSQRKLELTFNSITPSPLQSATQCATSETISQSPATPFIPQSTPYFISPTMSQPALQPVSQELCQPVFEPTHSQLPLPTANINFMLSPRDPRLKESVSALASNRLLMNSSLNTSPSKATAAWEPTTSSSSTPLHTTNIFKSPICCSKPTSYTNPMKTLGESISDRVFRSPFNNGDGDQCCSQNKIGDKLLMNGVGRLNDDSGNQLIGYQKSFDSSHEDDRNVSSNSQYFKSQNDSDRNSWKIRKGFGNFNNNDNRNQSTYRKGFGNSYNNGGNSSISKQGFGNLNNNNDDGSRPTYRKGFGDSSNNNGNSSMRSQGFGNLNNNNKDDGSRPTYRKGFGDSSNNDGNSSMKSQGFGNLNNNDDCNRPTYRKGFGKSYDNNGNSSMKSQGFGKPWANNKSGGRFNNNDDNRFTHRKGFGNYNNNDGNTFSGRNGNDTNSWSRNKGFSNSNDNGFGFKHRKGFGDSNSSDDFQQSDTKRFRRFNDSKFTPNRGFNNSDDYVPKSSKGFENTNNGSNWSRSQTRGRGSKRFFPYSDRRNDESSWGKSPKSFNNNDKPIEEESWDESPKQSNNKDKPSNEPELDKNVEHSNNINNNNELNRKFPWNRSPGPRPNSLDVDKSNEESWD